MERLKIPILIVHGQEDDSVPVQSSRDAIELLSEGIVLEEIPSVGYKLKGWVGESPSLQASDLMLIYRSGH